MPRCNRVTEWVSAGDIVATGDGADPPGVEDPSGRSAYTAAAPTAPCRPAVGSICVGEPAPCVEDDVGPGTEDLEDAASGDGESVPDPEVDSYAEECRVPGGSASCSVPIVVPPAGHMK